MTAKKVKESSNVVSLGSDADYINQEVESGDKSLTTALEHYRKAGERLSIVRDRYLGKKSVKGESFKAWVEKECRFGLRQAYRYISLSEEWSRLCLQSHNLDLKQALKQISDDRKTEAESTDEAIELKRSQFLSSLEVAKSKLVKACDYSKILAITSIDLSNYQDLELRFAYIKECNRESLEQLNKRRKNKLKEQTEQLETIARIEPELIEETRPAIKVKEEKITPVVTVRPEKKEQAKPVIKDEFEGFSDYEKSLVPQVLAGKTVVAAMFNFNQPYTAFLKWAQSRDLVVKIDRTSKTWGNPFKVGEDGDINDVMTSYKDYYLPRKFTIYKSIPTELRGKVLACWCKKDDCNIPGIASLQPCHGDILAAIANGEVK